MRRCGVLGLWILTFVRMTGCVRVWAFLSVVLVQAGRRGSAAWRFGALDPDFRQDDGEGVRAFLSVVLMLAGRRCSAALRFGTLGPDFRQDDGDGCGGASFLPSS